MHLSNTNSNNIGSNKTNNTATTSVTKKSAKEPETMKNNAAFRENVDEFVSKKKVDEEDEPHYQVPKSREPYYDAPRHLRPVPVYENMDIFYTGGVDMSAATLTVVPGGKMEPPKEKPPPPPADSPSFFDDKVVHDVVQNVDNADNWSSDNTYETISSTCRLPLVRNVEHPSPPVKRMNSTKRIKKELRSKRSSFLGIDGALDDEESYLELTVAPPPDMAQLLQEERRLEKQLYIKAGLCDCSDTGDSRDSGVSENHSRQSSEHYTNSSEENDRSIELPLRQQRPAAAPMPTAGELIYQNEKLMSAVQMPLLQTVRGNSAESWTESATVAAAATKSLTEATATANAKMLSIEGKIREQEEVLRVERELLQLEQEELKRQRENLMLRENIARRELQHGAKMFMSGNGRHSLQDLNGLTIQPPPTTPATTKPQNTFQTQRYYYPQPHALGPSQQIYANVPPNLEQQFHQVETDYRKSMSDLNEYSKRLVLPLSPTPLPPTKPMRAAVQSVSHGGEHRYNNNCQHHHQSTQNLSSSNVVSASTSELQPGGMSRNTLHALGAAPKPKYTDGWVQVQSGVTHQSNALANDPAWLSAYQQKRKSMPEVCRAYNNNNNNHWLGSETEPRQPLEPRQQHYALSNSNKPLHQHNGCQRGNPASSAAASSNCKPLPDTIIQTLTERVQIKGIGERKRFAQYKSSASNVEKSVLHAEAYHQQQQLPYKPLAPQQQHTQRLQTLQYQNNVPYRQPSATVTNAHVVPAVAPTTATSATVPPLTQGFTPTQEKVLSVSGKKKCSHCGDELGKLCYYVGCRGAAMIIESLLLFYHINCFKCCVCHVQLGDGLNGTDVRVRNHKLHCQNCYSSDDGIKFSCV